jgi:micrococcal nuclease
MKENKIIITILIGAIIIAGAIYFSRQKEGLITSKEKLPQPAKVVCQNIPELPDGALKLVTKIIDGDTFLIEGGYSVRILGIDADERGYPCYKAAKTSLEELILNKEVRLEKGEKDVDQYCRYLRHVFVDGKNVSLEMVKNGLAVAYIFSEDIKYRDEIAAAEKSAKENKAGCKWRGAP